MVDARFEVFLDAISQCFIQRNLQMWKDCVIYPFSLVTTAGPVIITNDAELREDFELYLSACDAMHLDEIVREPISLDDAKDGTWIGTYQTNLLSHGARATAPYTSSTLLKDISGRFRMLSILNARGHHDWTGKQPNAIK